MSRPTAAELSVLRTIAREIRDTAEESGYTVSTAIAQHEAFGRSRGPASNLERSLVLDAARRGASQAGAGAVEVPGGGLDIMTSGGGAIRMFRVKRVTLSQEDELVVVCGAGSSLLVVDPEGLLRQERWVLGFVTSDDHTVDRLVAAEVVNWTGEGPYRLIFGTVIELEEELPPQGFGRPMRGCTGSTGRRGWATRTSVDDPARSPTRKAVSNGVPSERRRARPCSASSTRA